MFFRLDATQDERTFHADLTECAMPLVRITFVRDRSPEDTRAICDGLYDAMRTTFAVPADDRFMIVERPRPGDVACDPHYMGMNRSDDLVIVQITCNDTRTLEQKKSFFAAVCDNLVRCGVPADDVFVNIVEVKKENWSFGRGVAQYA